MPKLIFLNVRLSYKLSLHIYDNFVLKKKTKFTVLSQLSTLNTNLDLSLCVFEIGSHGQLGHESASQPCLGNRDAVPAVHPLFHRFLSNCGVFPSPIA